MTLFIAILFFLLSPGILTTLPPKGNKLTVVAVHAILFALIYHVSHKMIWNLFYGNKVEKFMSKPNSSCPTGSTPTLTPLGQMCTRPQLPIGTPGTNACTDGKSCLIGYRCSKGTCLIKPVIKMQGA